MYEGIQNEYFEWICSLVVDSRYTKHITYNKLLHYLFSREFTFFISNDYNRAYDGINYRNRFGLARGYSSETIKKCLDLGPCRVLEMMVALATRIEEQIMVDYDYGDRTSQWFWDMMVSLGLSNMSDDNFNYEKVERTIDIFLNRDYAANGQGGLFALKNCKYDLRKEEIWCQAMWYLDENFDFSL